MNNLFQIRQNTHGILAIETFIYLLFLSILLRLFPVQLRLIWFKTKQNEDKNFSKLLKTHY